ncbi:MAG TPA: NAD(P)/FAD-dependent oxidoreductase [Polyangiaceae bacterium]|nr:NAD(P)/FAD-dependent oxidoreductase [Polyangiaceae bacterium]
MPESRRETAPEFVDVLIVGAGISGIGAAYHLQKHCPKRSYRIFEARETLGGTWDLFRYPGIRSDSDMYTLGYSFRPWTNPKAIADGPSILSYLRDTATENGIDRRITYRRRVKSASWSSDRGTWIVVAENTETGEEARVECRFVMICAGYYDYDAGYTPDFPGVSSFRGRVVHPQHWPEGLDYDGKRVVVIGSGATAVTLVPELSKRAAHVTMLQRSPTYVISRPSEDPAANWLRERLPEKVAYGITRWKNVLLGMAFFQAAKRRPEFIRKMILGGVRKELGPEYDVRTHFSPRYAPWDQRVCLVPDHDLFAAIRDGRAEVVTDQIRTFTEHGLLLESGTELPADIIVTATGLELKVLGGVSLEVDGARVELPKTTTYKGMMFSDVPNLTVCLGYTNASWTLKVDLTCEYACRLMNHMDRKGYRKCTPRLTDPTLSEEPWADLSSGYIQRKLHLFPKQGSKRPWRLHQNYALDLLNLEYSSLTDGAMEFSR